jgi:hypothetical protein
MGRRDLLSAEERRRLFGVPVNQDALARLYTFEPRDIALILARREERNQLGFALQLALIRHPGLTLSQVKAPPGADLDSLVGFIATPSHLLSPRNKLYPVPFIRCCTGIDGILYIPLCWHRVRSGIKPIPTRR